MKKLMILGAALSLSLATGAATLKNGDSIVFLGDSITRNGWNYSDGYIRICQAAFKWNNLDVTIHPAGIGGHKSPDMLARLEKDVLSKKPTWMTLSCGVNDVWHQFYSKPCGVSLEDYKKNMTEIVTRAQAAGIKVIILAATMISENADDKKNKTLIPYNAFLRELAKEKGCVFVDFNTEMQKRVAKYRAKTGAKGNIMTDDGVHVNFLGNHMMAFMLLKEGFGFTPDEIEKANRAVINDIYVTVRGNFTTTVKGGTYLNLLERALDNKKMPTTYLKGEFEKSVRGE